MTTDPLALEAASDVEQAMIMIHIDECSSAETMRRLLPVLAPYMARARAEAELNALVDVADTFDLSRKDAMLMRDRIAAVRRVADAAQTEEDTGR